MRSPNAAPPARPDPHVRRWIGASSPPHRPARRRSSSPSGATRSPRTAARSCCRGLIRLLAPFGINERLARTSVFRLAREGWLAAKRVGRAQPVSADARRRATVRASLPAHLRAAGRRLGRRWEIVIADGAAARGAASAAQELQLGGLRRRWRPGVLRATRAGAHSASRSPARRHRCRLIAVPGDATTPRCADLLARLRRFRRRGTWRRSPPTTANSCAASAASSNASACASMRRPRSGAVLHRAHAADPRISPRAAARPAAAGGAAAARLARRAAYASVARLLPAHAPRAERISPPCSPRRRASPPANAAFYERFGGLGS